MYITKTLRETGIDWNFLTLKKGSTYNPPTTYDRETLEVFSFRK